MMAMKRKLTALSLGAVLITALVACPNDGRGELNFNTEPTIFRGVWTAQARAKDQTQTTAMRLELTATYRDKFGYDVTGSFKFADDTPLEVAGFVNGSTRESYLLAALPPSLTLSLKNASSDVGNLNCYWFKNFAEKTCTLSLSGGSRSGSYDVLNLVKP
jgi:hypothetical protein